MKVSPFWTLLVALLIGATSASAQLCGPVVLAGHDADDHGFESVYAQLFDQLWANHTNGGSGILVIGADVGTKAATWITNVAGLMVVPQIVVFVNDAAIATQSFSGFAILHVPSDAPDTVGGITQVEADLLNARFGDVSNFIAGGGGLFGLTQGELTNSWGYINAAVPVAHLDVPPSGSLPSGNLFDDLSSTASGVALGIFDVNLDGCCFHNVFTTFPANLSVLAFANEPTDPAYHGQAVFIGGTSSCFLLSVSYDWVTASAMGSRVVVRWATASELDTVGFVVYRSSDASGAGAVALPGFVPAHGAGADYEYVDETPQTSFYFVEEHTNAGRGDRSPIVSVGSEAGPAGGRQRTTRR